MSNLTDVEQFRRRLKGVHRIAWSASDVERIAKRFGLITRDVQAALPGLPNRPIQRAADTDKSHDFTATISTADVDRSGDTIAVAGWKLDEFRKNPVVFINHVSSDLPVARSPSVWTTGGKLKASIKLAPAAANPLAEQVRQLIEGRFLSAVSVGFVPIRWEFAKDSSRPFGINFLEQKLLEFSICGIPANPAAMIDITPVAIGASKTSGKNVLLLQRERELAQLRRGAHR